MMKLEKLAKALATARAKAQNIHSIAYEAMLMARSHHAKELSKTQLNLEKANAAMMAELKKCESEFPDGAKSAVFDGIKYGFRFSAEKIEVSKETVAKILEKFSDSGRYLIMKQTPDKGELAKLDDKELKKVGAMRVPGSNEPFVMPVNGDLETLIGSVGAL